VGVVAAASGLGLATYIHQLRGGKDGGVGALLLPELQAAGGKEEEAKTPKVSVRELRYKEFASIVYKGEPYMSGRDFLESVARDEPRGQSSSSYSASKLGASNLVSSLSFLQYPL